MNMNIKSNTAFWILWNPLSTRAPEVRYWTKEDAYKVAAEMARTHKQAFYVLKAESIHAVDPAPVRITELE